MAIQMIGIDHTKAVIDIRTIFSFTKKRSAEALKLIKEEKGIRGCVLISTCNRMELYVSTEEGYEGDLYELLCRVKGLPEGLDTGIGERGIRLSGGQRQRIGIARALFEDPEVLVLDEATSALDNETEAAIMDSINRLHGRKTLIIIAHRLQTIEKCDMVYRVENGQIARER